MRKVLIISTTALEPLNDVVAVAQASLPDTTVTTFDLTVPAPDYNALLTAIFDADSVQVG